MRRDSIFYRIFQQFPSLLFELISNPPENAERYTFESIEVKETAFRIDGVFQPPDRNGIVYFGEVQFQKDELFYERLMSEAWVYFFRHRDRCHDWRAVVIYPARSIEQAELHPFQDSFASNRITRIYLNEVGNIDRLPLGVGLMVLTILDDEPATVAARDLIDRSAREPEIGRAIIEMVATIIAYKFVDLSRLEVEAMLGIRLEDSRAFREVREEGKAEGKAEGKQEEGQSLILRMLTRRFGEISPTLRSRIQELPLPLLEELGEALLDFTDIDNLIAWLDRV